MRLFERQTVVWTTFGLHAHRGGRGVYGTNLLDAVGPVHMVWRIGVDPAVTFAEERRAITHAPDSCASASSAAAGAGGAARARPACAACSGTSRSRAARAGHAGCAATRAGAGRGSVATRHGA